MPTLISKLIKPAHKQVAKAIGYALMLGETNGYIELVEVIAARLSQAERVSLGYAALKSVDPAVRLELYELMSDIETVMGSPLPFAKDIRDDAEFWASNASQTELRAYSMAIFNKMTKADKQRFVKKLTRNA